MRRNHVLELKRETRACEQPSALSLTILIFQFALNCHIYLNLILVGLKEWAAGRSSKEEKSPLEKKTDTTTTKSEIRSVWKRRVLKFFDRWIFHRLTWRLTQSHLDDVYQEDFRFSFSCSCYGEIFFTTMFNLQPNHVWISKSPRHCSFVAHVCLAWWRWSGSCPQHTSLWESLNHLTPTSSSKLIMILQNGITERAQERCQHQHRPSEMKKMKRKMEKFKHN